MSQSYFSTRLRGSRCQHPALAVALVLLASPALAETAAADASQAPASPHSVTANVSLASQYIYRGISQSNQNPVLQGGVDYTHSSGFYLGTWASGISWISDSTPGSVSHVELDLYGGYKQTIGDWSYDLGYLHYHYPGHFPASFVKANTDELYAQVGWKYLTFKFSQSLGDTFGYTKAKNSTYLDLTAAYPINDRITVVGHIGRQEFRGNQGGVSNYRYSYTDYKLEGQYAFNSSLSIAGGRSDTNAQRAPYTNPQGTYLGDGMWYAYVRKTF